MSDNSLDEKTHEFGGKGFGGGGEQVREGEEIKQVGKEEELGAGEEIRAENEVREGEEIGAKNVVRERAEFVEGGGSCSVENDGETMSASSSNKRIKEMSIDRLSALPDSILIRILSFLEVKEAAITSVLSRRWQFLWTDLPKLVFWDSSNEIEKTRKFVDWVHRTLVFCNGRDLTSFEVDFTYDKCFASDVNVWVEFAVKNMVRDVSLNLNSSSGDDFYTLPQMMFDNATLIRLSTQRCIIAPRGTIQWRSLASLCIAQVEMRQHVIEMILSGCPSLYSLVLRECWGYNCLEVYSQKLHSLGIGEGEDGKSEPLLEISVPYARSLIIRHYPKGRQLRLKNIPSLDSALVDFRGSDWDASCVDVMSNMKDIYENLQHVKELELGNQCIEVLSMLVMNGWQLPQSRRECLKINASAGVNSFSGIIALLESSPNLETLVINIYEPIEASAPRGPAARHDLDCDLLHLKTVNITTFAHEELPSEPMLTLIQMFFKRAKVLEKMVANVDIRIGPYNRVRTFVNYHRDPLKTE